MKSPKKALAISVCLTNLWCNVTLYLLGEEENVAPNVPAGLKHLRPGYMLSMEICESYFYNCVVDLGHPSTQDLVMHTNPLEFCKINY